MCSLHKPLQLFVLLKPPKVRALHNPLQLIAILKPLDVCSLHKPLQLFVLFKPLSVPALHPQATAAHRHSQSPGRAPHKPCCWLSSLSPLCVKIIPKSV